MRAAVDTHLVTQCYVNGRVPLRNVVQQNVCEDRSATRERLLPSRSPSANPLRSFDMVLQATEQELIEVTDQAFAQRLAGNDKFKAGDLRGALLDYHQVLLRLKGE